MAVAGDAFDVGVKFEVVHRQLVVAFEEAGRDDPLAQHALDADRDLALVGRLHHELAALRFEDAALPMRTPACARERRLPVGIDGAQLEQRVAFAITSSTSFMRRPSGSCPR